jgi:hypothetical protein
MMAAELPELSNRATERGFAFSARVSHFLIVKSSSS